MMLKFRSIFGTSKMAVIGMIHIKSLPGTPKNVLSVDDIVDAAIKEAEIYNMANVDGVLIENMGDLPYIQPQHFGPEVVATMTRVANEIRSMLPANMPCGIQILAGGNKEALAVSKACRLQFIRSEGFVFSHVSDEGWTDACAGTLLRYRKILDCEDVLVLADIKKKHSAHAVTRDVSVAETAKAAEFFLADGVILTGTSTGEETDQRDLAAVSHVTDLPILIGSGVSINNVEKFSSANGLIVGSHFKKTGRWESELDINRVQNFVEKVKCIRQDKDKGN